MANFGQGRSNRTSDRDRRTQTGGHGRVDTDGQTRTGEDGQMNGHGDEPGH